MDWKTEERTGRQFLRGWCKCKGEGVFEQGAGWLDGEIRAPGGTVRSIALTSGRQTRNYARRIALATGMPVAAAYALDVPIRELVAEEMAAAQEEG